MRIAISDAQKSLLPVLNAYLKSPEMKGTVDVLGVQEAILKLDATSKILKLLKVMISACQDPGVFIQDLAAVKNEFVTQQNQQVHASATEDSLVKNIIDAIDGLILEQMPQNLKGSESQAVFLQASRPERRGTALFSSPPPQIARRALIGWRNSIAHQELHMASTCGQQEVLTIKFFGEVESVSHGSEFVHSFSSDPSIRLVPTEIRVVVEQTQFRIDCISEYARYNQPEQLPDIILLSCHMPVKDILRISDSIRAQSPNVFIIMVDYEVSASKPNESNSLKALAAVLHYPLLDCSKHSPHSFLLAVKALHDDYRPQASRSETHNFSA